MYLALGAYAFIMGIISGYPIGAKIVTNFRQEGIASKAECERLLAYTNNSGPLFIIGTVGISLFCNSSIGILLFTTHLLAGITVGIIFRFWKNNDALSNSKTLNNPKNIVRFKDLGEILGKSITKATSTILMIGGFVVLFSVIISILQNTNLLNLIANLLEPIFKTFGISSNSFTIAFSSGIIEITTGIKQISAIPYKQISVNIILSAFLLGFGGISVLLQVLAIISKTDISIKPYIIGKVLHGIIAAIYTYIFISNFSIFNLNL